MAEIEITEAQAKLIGLLHENGASAREADFYAWVLLARPDLLVDLAIEAGGLEQVAWRDPGATGGERWLI